ncbi:phosphotransferase family protein [Aspergillus lucknowensis]|uniref:Aminoglycoside phosphotransferase domain-containing protein n=1 Tax=Aspergillus lucknowensis TaxID=176173 RepID=A0ABR4LQZ7_9EURO
MAPLLPASPDIESEVSEKLASVLQKHYLLPVHVAGIHPLAGHLHSLYLVQLSNETQLLLKCSPKPTTPLLRREHILLDTEARVLFLLNQNTIPCIPQIFHYDPLGDLLGPSLLIRRHIPGPTLKEVEAYLTSQERKAVDRSLGLLVKRIAQHVSGSFGGLGQVASAGGTQSWRDAFLGLFEGILRDSEDVFINLPYGEIRHQITRLAPVLDEVLVPRLVVIDFGHASQVFVDPASKRICGISGLGTAVWGDVYMAKIFENPSSSVLDGFGSGYTKCPSGQTRQLLYSCYRSVHSIVLQYYRKNQDVVTEIDVRRQLMTTLARMAIV